MTRPMTPEARRALANAHRAAIRAGHIQCIPGVCRHGWPDIWHPPSCYWNQAVEAIYKIERELEASADVDSRRPSPIW